MFGVSLMELGQMVHEPWFTADAFSRNGEVKTIQQTGMCFFHAFHVVQRYAANGEYTFRGILQRRPVGSDPVEQVFDRRRDSSHGQDFRPDKVETGGTRGNSTACGQNYART